MFQLRYTFLILFFYVVFPSFVFSQENWKPNLQNLDGKLEFMGSVLENHPTLPQENLNYRRNLIETLGPVDEIMKDLGEDAIDLSVKRSQFYGNQYSASEVKYDETKLKSLKNEFKSYVNDLPIKKFSNLEDDLIAIKKSFDTLPGEKRAKEFKRASERLMKLSPIIYDDAGKVMNTSNDDLFHVIDEITHTDLSNLYKDKYRYLKDIALNISNKKELKMGILSDVIPSLDNNFLRKEIPNIIKPIQSDNKTAIIRKLSIEDIPAGLTPYRGCVGNDCSALSVPYYGLEKNSKVFWVRKSLDLNAKIDGYVFVNLVEVDGKKIPYIVTINGSTLTADDTKQLVKMIGETYGTERVIVPDFDINPHVVNTDPVKMGLSFKKSEKLQVNFSDGWNKIAANPRSNVRYTNYYDPEKLSGAKIVKTSEIQHSITKTVHESLMRYAKPQEIEKMNKVNRAILAHHALDGSKEQADKVKVLEKLNLTEDELAAIKPLIEVSPIKPVTYSEFKKMQELLDLKHENLLDLDVLSLGRTLKEVYAGDPQALKKGKWDKIIVKAHNKIAKQLLETINHGIDSEFSSKVQTGILSGFKSLESLPKDHFDNTAINKYIKEIFENEEILKKYPEGALDMFTFLSANFPSRIDNESLIKIINNSYELSEDSFQKLLKLIEKNKDYLQANPEFTQYPAKVIKKNPFELTTFFNLNSVFPTSELNYSELFWDKLIKNEINPQSLREYLTEFKQRVLLSDEPKLKSRISNIDLQKNYLKADEAHLLIFQEFKEFIEIDPNGIATFVDIDLTKNMDKLDKEPHLQKLVQSFLIEEQKRYPKNNINFPLLEKLPDITQIKFTAAELKNLETKNKQVIFDQLSNQLNKVLNSKKFFEKNDKLADLILNYKNLYQAWDNKATWPGETPIELDRKIVGLFMDAPKNLSDGVMEKWHALNPVFDPSVESQKIEEFLFSKEYHTKDPKKIKDLSSENRKLIMDYLDKKMRLDGHSFTYTFDDNLNHYHNVFTHIPIEERGSITKSYNTVLEETLKKYLDSLVQKKNVDPNLIPNVIDLMKQNGLESVNTLADLNELLGDTLIKQVRLPNSSLMPDYGVLLNAMYTGKDDKSFFQKAVISLIENIQPTSPEFSDQHKLFVKNFESLFSKYDPSYSDLTKDFELYRKLLNEKYLLSGVDDSYKFDILTSLIKHENRIYTASNTSHISSSVSSSLAYTSNEIAREYLGSMNDFTKGQFLEFYQLTKSHGQPGTYAASPPRKLSKFLLDPEMQDKSLFMYHRMYSYSRAVGWGETQNYSKGFLKLLINKNYDDFFNVLASNHALLNQPDFSNWHYYNSDKLKEAKNDFIANIFMEIEISDPEFHKKLIEFANKSEENTALIREKFSYLGRGNTKSLQQNFDIWIEGTKNNPVLLSNYIDYTMNISDMQQDEVFAKKALVFLEKLKTNQNPELAAKALNTLENYKKESQKLSKKASDVTNRTFASKSTSNANLSAKKPGILRKCWIDLLKAARLK